MKTPAPSSVLYLPALDDSLTYPSNFGLTFKRRHFVRFYLSLVADEAKIRIFYAIYVGIRLDASAATE